MRCIVLLLLLTCLGCPWDPPSPADHAATSKKALAAWIEKQRKPDGGYGPPMQERSEERWTFWAVRSLQLAGLEPPEPRRLREWLLACRPGTLSSRERARIEAARALGFELPPRCIGPVVVEPPPLIDWEGSVPLSELEDAVFVAKAAGRDVDEEMVLATLERWRSDGGGWGYPAPLDQVFAHVRAGRRTGKVKTGHGHPASLASTASAIAILRMLGRPVPDAGSLPEALRRPPQGLQRIRDWVRATGATSHEGVADRIRRMRHGRGGFGFHVRSEGRTRSIGRASLEATWLAMEVLDVLQRPLPRLPKHGGDGSAISRMFTAGMGARRWQAAVQVGPSAGVALELAQRCGFDLVLFKGDRADAEARNFNRIAKARGLSNRAGVAQEEYDRAWGEPGVGYVTHCSDVVHAPGAEVGARSTHAGFDSIVEAWRPARRAGAAILSCSYRQRELLSGPYAARYADEGYDMVMGAWAFAPSGDLVREFPWLHEVSRLFGNHDAHGADCFHWLARGLRTRTLFYATSGDVAGFKSSVPLAVAHAGPHYAIYGWGTYVEEADRKRSEWDIGRPRDVDPEAWWLPAPVIVPIDAHSASELPHLDSGHAVLIRAAETAWDDALPHEVVCTIDGKPVAVEMAPVGLDRIPALVARLPSAAKAGPHEVVVTAFGRTTKETRAFGPPVRKRTFPDLSALVPTELTMRKPGEDTFMRIQPSAPPVDGKLRLQTNRADLILRPPDAGKTTTLVLEHGPVSEGLRATLFVNGREIAVLPTGPAGVRRYDLRPSRLRREANWITLRMNQPHWVPGVVPKGDFWLSRVAMVTKKD